MMSRTVAPLGFGLLLLAAWQAVVMILHIPEYLLPAPTAIAASVDRALAMSFAVTFIEFVRGVPLIAVLFMASVMLPLFVPERLSPDKLLRALIRTVECTARHGSPLPRRVWLIHSLSTRRKS